MPGSIGIWAILNRGSLLATSFFRHISSNVGKPSLEGLIQETNKTITYLARRLQIAHISHITSCMSLLNLLDDGRNSSTFVRGPWARSRSRLFAASCDTHMTTPVSSPCNFNVTALSVYWIMALGIIVGDPPT